MMTRRALAVALIVSSVLAGIGASILSATFGWPARLDDRAADALPAFVEAEAAIRLGFALELFASLALVPAILGLGRLIGPAATAWTAFGVAGAFVQTLGWVRWPIVVPRLAQDYLAAAPGSAARESIGTSYDLLNAYAGGALGEHLGWLFMGIWGLGSGVLLARVVPRWVATIGLVLTVGWLPALMVAGYQGTHAGAFAELGSLVFTIWLVWLVLVAIFLLRRRGPNSVAAAPENDVRGA